MKKIYHVNVHYDYYASVEVEATSENEALYLAKVKADEMDLKDMQFGDHTDSCVTEIENI